MDYPCRRPFVVKGTQHHQHFRNMVLLGGHDRHTSAWNRTDNYHRMWAQPQAADSRREVILTGVWPPNCAEYDHGGRCIMAGRIRGWKVLYFVRIGSYLQPLFVCCTTSLGKWHLRKQHDTHGQEVFLVVERSSFLNVAFFKIGSRRDSLAQTGFAPFGKGMQLFSGFSYAVPKNPANWQTWY